MIVYSFDWLLLVFSLLGFVCSHYLWPPKHEEQRAWYDILEVVVGLPFRAMSLFMRGLGKAFKNADSRIDF